MQLFAAWLAVVVCRKAFHFLYKPVGLFAHLNLHGSFNHFHSIQQKNNFYESPF